MPSPTPLLVVELLGVFAFAVNGALTALRTARLDIVGVVTLGMITALGGGALRDILLGALPPATFVDGRYLGVAAAGGLLAFAAAHGLVRFGRTIDVLDAAGLSLFAVAGAGKALELGAGALQAVILGTITAVGGGTLRDVLVRQVPSVLSSGLYAVPAALGAATAVLGESTGVDPLLGAVAGALACFAVRVAGLHLDWQAPRPRVPGDEPGKEARPTTP